VTSEPAELVEHYNDVVRALRQGNVVPVLGAGANLTGRPDPGKGTWRGYPDLPTGGQLARHLAKEFGYDGEARDDLLRVSQYIAVRKGVGTLYGVLHDVFDEDYPWTPLHEFLASLSSTLAERGLLRTYPLIMTTNYDDLLERAFRRVDQEFDLCVYLAEGKPAERGRFLHFDPSGTARVIEGGEEDLSVSFDARPVVLKIHGFVQRAAQPNSDSFVITEDHYLDYLTKIDLSRLLPAPIYERLSNCHFLFLGYSMRDWNLRAILRRLWTEDSIDYPSWSVQLRPDALDCELWAKRGVEVIDRPLDVYLAGLVERLAIEFGRGRTPV
jgi:SIR2-like domain